MTDENTEVLDDEILDGEVEDIEGDKPEETPEPELPKGYKTKEDLIAEGKDPAGWLPPEAFAERKERFKVESQYRKKLEAMEQQLGNVNKFHAKQLEILKGQLNNQRDEAIMTGDVKEVKRLDGEIKDLETVKSQQEYQKLPEEIEWESENQWIFNKEAKRVPRALQVYAEAINSGKTVAGALRAVDKAVAKFDEPAQQVERKRMAPAADSSKTTATKRGNDAPSVSWDSLTGEELAVYEADPDLWESKKEFLQTIAKTRT